MHLICNFSKECDNKMKEKEIERLTQLKKQRKRIHSKGFKYICGIDEAGRGPLAGPVAVAGVIMPEDSMIEGVNDSKKVSEKKREKLYDLITEQAISYFVAIINHDVIDNINILNATKQGVTQVIDGLEVKPDLILVDALTHINTRGIPYDSIIKGDAKCYSISAASILAKVTRDRIMRQWDEIYHNMDLHKIRDMVPKCILRRLESMGFALFIVSHFTTHFVVK